MIINMATESEFTNTLNQLTQQVSQFTNNVEPSTEISGASSGFMSKLGPYTTYICYAAVPVIIALILFFIKPGFIMSEVSVDGKIPEKKLSIKKLLIATVVISVVIFVLYLFYTRRKQD